MGMPHLQMCELNLAGAKHDFICSSMACGMHVHML